MLLTASSRCAQDASEVVGQDTVGGAELFSVVGDEGNLEHLPQNVLQSITGL